MEYGIILLAYLIGSIPFGLLLTKAAGLGDITAQGSGNIGATNVLRVGGRKLGLLTLALDGGKGAAMVLLAKPFFPPIIVAVVALASVLGHIFPLWLHGKGGKGVATTLAVWLSLDWLVGVFACAVWLLVFFLTRISSLSAIAAMATTAIFACIFASIPVAVLTVFLSLLVIIRHQDNIRRLLHGTEKRSNIKK